jgi:hypothetical protein
MTGTFHTSGGRLANTLIPAHATLGYPNRAKKLHAMTERQKKFADFSPKAHEILLPLLGELFSIREELAVLPSAGFSGPIVRAGLRCLDR